MTKAHRTADIPNRMGLHARPAAELVRRAGTFASEIRVAKGQVEVNAKSIMGVLMLAAEQGSTLRFEAEGEDAEEAVEALVKLVESGFGED